METIMLILGYGVFLPAFGVGSFLITKSYLLGKKSKEWPSMNGTIDYFDLTKKSSGDSGTRVSFSVAYNYTIDGSEYTGNRIQYGAPFIKDQQKLYEKSKTTKSTKVYYNPDNPKQAVLIQGYGAAKALPFIMVILFFFAIAYSAIYSFLLQ